MAWLAFLDRLTTGIGRGSAKVALGLGFTPWMIVEIALLGGPGRAASSADAATRWALYGI